jgi:hypothetical protein
VIPCLDTGQDGEVRAGMAWPEPRFISYEDSVADNLTGLVWTRDANPCEFPLMWEEALGYVAQINREQRFGHRDWRLPNRKELFSLISHVRINPALPAGHPFTNIFPGYYWTSTTCVRLPREAWYVHLGGGRVFKGMKHGSYVVWPVRSGVTGLIAIPRSGQDSCYSGPGKVIPCSDSGQDGALQMGMPWPKPRFVEYQQTVLDKLTGLVWARLADLTFEPVDWESALKAIKTMNDHRLFGYSDWRLPNIRELESLIDAGSHSPALPHGYPFSKVRKFYWSSTTSTYDPRYAWVLYMEDGSLGVGYKPNASFFVWGVRMARWPKNPVFLL